MLNVPRPPSRGPTLGHRDGPVPLRRFDLDHIVAALRTSRGITPNVRHRGLVRPVPSRAVLSAIVDDLSAALFPRHFGQSESGVAAFDGVVRSTLSTALGLLVEQVRLGLSFTRDDRLSQDEIGAEALTVAQNFAAGLPGIRALLVGDLHAALGGDPAASSTPEILLGYPGMAALIHHRLAHRLYDLGAELPTRLVAEV